MGACHAICWWCWNSDYFNQGTVCKASFIVEIHNRRIKITFSKNVIFFTSFLSQNSTEIFFLMLVFLRRTSFSGHLLSPIFQSSLHITVTNFHKTIWRQLGCVPVLWHAGAKASVSCSVFWILILGLSDILNLIVHA